MESEGKDYQTCVSNYVLNAQNNWSLTFRSPYQNQSCMLRIQSMNASVRPSSYLPTLKIVCPQIRGSYSIDGKQDYTIMTLEYIETIKVGSDDVTFYGTTTEEYVDLKDINQNFTLQAQNTLYTDTSMNQNTVITLSFTFEWC